MNTIWLKVMGLAVLAVVVIILIGVFTSGTDSQAPEPEQPQKTFYDQAEEDKEKFLTKPQALDSQGQTATKEQSQPTENKTETPPTPPVLKPKPAQPVTLYFKEPGEIEKIEAERLLNVAVPGRSIGRLPMTGYNLMVDNCRAIIQRWPDSFYAYSAKKMLADLPERYQKRYQVSEKEKDVSMFSKSRSGTKPFTIKEESR
ncbi:MAG: hypothetical protein JW837_09365 [Sedimentisphaerales bacterium]|nr:hypothetical protein [Sedimentisphaerales bacterium]